MPIPSLINRKLFSSLLSLLQVSCPAVDPSWSACLSRPSSFWTGAGGAVELLREEALSTAAQEFTPLLFNKSLHHDQSNVAKRNRSASSRPLGPLPSGPRQPWQLHRPLAQSLMESMQGQPGDLLKDEKAKERVSATLEDGNFDTLEAMEALRKAADSGARLPEASIIAVERRILRSESSFQVKMIGVELMRLALMQDALPMTELTFQAFEAALKTPDPNYDDIDRYDPVVRAFLRIINLSDHTPGGDPAIKDRIVRILENTFQEEGLSHTSYNTASHLLRRIAKRAPKLLANHPLAQFIVSISDNLTLMGHPFAHYRIYSPAFREVVSEKGLAQTLDPAQYSIGLAAYRLLQRHGLDLSEDNIRKATRFVIRKRAAIANDIILGPGRRVIAIAHEEARFKISLLDGIATEAGVQSQDIESFKGPDRKAEILSQIATKQGPLTVMFEGHGGRNQLWLSQGNNGEQETEGLDDPKAISYQEMADALTRRSDLADVKIIVMSCYSYNFAVQLLNALDRETARGLPTLVASSNYDRLSFTNAPLGNLVRSKRSLPIVTMGDIMDAEAYVFDRQDTSIFSSLTSSEKETLRVFFGNMAPVGMAPEAGLSSGFHLKSVSALELSGPPETTARRGRPEDLPTQVIESGSYFPTPLLVEGLLDLISGNFGLASAAALLSVVFLLPRLRWPPSRNTFEKLHESAFRIAA